MVIDRVPSRRTLTLISTTSSKRSGCRYSHSALTRGQPSPSDFASSTEKPFERIKGVLRRLHEPEEVREVHDAGHVCLEKFDHACRAKFVGHGLPIYSLTRCISNVP